MSEVSTAAAIIRFTEQLQDASGRFYRELAEHYPEQRPALEEVARRCEKDKTQIARTYRETVTDALETNFSFDALALPQELLAVSAPAGDWASALARAAELEEGAAAFYEQAAARAESLLATIPRAYQRVAARRREQAAAWRAGA